MVDNKNQIDIKDLQKIEKLDFLGVSLYEKKDPVYESKILNVPIKYIALFGVAIFGVEKLKNVLNDR